MRSPYETRMTDLSGRVTGVAHYSKVRPWPI